MGLDISVRKPTKFIGTEYLEDKEDWVYIYSLDFAPIKHLTMFRKGYWEAEWYSEPSFSMCYGTFSRQFRESICKVMFGKSYNDTIEAMDKGEIAFDEPFAEMLYFADNEGCFDYVVAEKLLKDFRNNAERILPTMSDYLKDSYNDYMAVLEKCVEVKGVVDYH